MTDLKDQAKKFEEHQQTVQAMTGILSENQVTSIVALAMAQIQQHNNSQKAKEKERLNEFIMLALQGYIAQLNADIQVMENGFEAQFGDAWREEIAIRVFDADDFPLQKEGETTAEYRERLEKELQDQMLNTDGSIKDQYKNDPELRKYAEWAQKCRHRDQAVEAAHTLKTNPDSPEAKAVMQELEAKANSELNNLTADQLEGNEQQQGEVLNLDDNLRDQTGSKDMSDYASSFSAPDI